MSRAAPDQRRELEATCRDLEATVASIKRRHAVERAEALAAGDRRLLAKVDKQAASDLDLFTGALRDRTRQLRWLGKAR